MRNLKLHYAITIFLVLGTGYGTYEFSRIYFVSKVNVNYYYTQTEGTKDLVRVLQWAEKRYGSEPFSKLDCDVFVTHYYTIARYKDIVDDYGYTFTDEDAIEAKQAIDNALKVLEDYKNRHGERRCENANLIVGGPF